MPLARLRVCEGVLLWQLVAMLWAALPVYVLVLLSIGRLFAVHGAGSHATPRASLFNPASCLVSGAALWAIWWLVLVPLLGGGTLMMAGVFALFAMGLSALLYRTWHLRKGVEHFLSPILIGLVLLLPLLMLVPQTTPAYVADYTFLTHLRHLSAAGGWPTATQAAAQGLTSLATAPGWLALLAPLAQIGLPLPALAPALSLLAVLAAASALTTAVGIHVRWSNLLLASCAGLLIVVLTLPLPLPVLMEQQSAVIWMALALLAACLPLLSSMRLPAGIATLPCALALGLLAMLHPQGILAAMGIAALWILRLVIEGNWGHRVPTLAGILSAHLLVLVPLISWGISTLVWQRAGGAMAQDFWMLPLQGWGSAPAMPHASLLWRIALWAGVGWALVYGLGPWLKMSVCGGLRGVVSTHAWRSMAAPLLGGLAILAVATQNLDAWLPGMAWLALFVLWKRGLLWYQTTVWQRRSFEMPWRIGALMALALMIAAQAAPKPTPTMAQRVAHQARELVVDGMIPQGAAVGVWVVEPGQKPLPTILAYALAPYATVIGLEGQPATLGELHRTSRAAGTEHLLVAMPADRQRALLGLPEDSFMTLAVTTPQQVLIGALFSKNGGRVSLPE